MGLQIKISTASKLLSISEGAALEELAKPGRNIEICARYIRLLINKYLEDKKHPFIAARYNDLYDYIAKNYIGATDATMYNAVLYAAILRERSRLDLYSRLKIKNKRNQCFRGNLKAPLPA